MEGSKYTKYLMFMFHQIQPSYTYTIINKYDKPSKMNYPSKEWVLKYQNELRKKEHNFYLSLLEKVHDDSLLEYKSNI